MVSTGRALTLGLTLPIVGLGTALIKSGIDFEDAFAGVAKTVEGVSVGFEQIVGFMPEYQAQWAAFQENVNKLGGPGQFLSAREAFDAFVATLTDADKAAIFANEHFGQLTEEGLRIRNAFREMALEIPISAAELSKVGQVAGELGVPADTIVEFTRVAALMGVATNLSADQAAEAFGRFGNIFNVSRAI